VTTIAPSASASTSDDCDIVEGLRAVPRNDGSRVEAGVKL